MFYLFNLHTNIRDFFEIARALSSSKEKERAFLPKLSHHRFPMHPSLGRGE
jgi:hypothetical protein